MQTILNPNSCSDTNTTDNSTMTTRRARPHLCESPTFLCPCPAQVYNRTVGRWYCAYCTSQSYSALNRCCRCHLPGQCVDKYTGNWYCGEHGRQCDVLVPRPPGCGWPARRLPCSQRSLRFSQGGNYICDDHFEEVAVRPDGVVFRLSRVPTADLDDALEYSLTALDADGEVLDLDSFSSVVERDCPICLSPKIKWRRLTACGHELCEDCLKEQMRSSLHNKFLCPFDRRPLFDLPFG